MLSWRELMRVCVLQVGIQCVKLEGSMSLEVRNKMIQTFNNDPNVTVFLMSLKAGGVALNLTVASHVMLCDPWWNPAGVHITTCYQVERYASGSLSCARSTCTTVGYLKPI
jgi:hypothetical protein